MKTHKERGSVLIAVIVLLVIVSMSCLAVTLTIQDYALLNKRGRAELQSFYVAEAGALEVVGWFNTSGTIVSDPSLAPLFRRSKDDVYENLATAFASIGEGEAINVPEGLRPILRDASGAEVGRVTALKLVRPTSQQIAKIPYLICIVRSRGKSTSGTPKLVELYIAYHRLRIDGTPGVILSRDVAAFGGNVGAHWGDIYSRESIMMPNLSQMITRAEDPWLNFRSEQWTVFNTTWKCTDSNWGKPAGTCVAFQDPDDPIVKGTIVKNTNMPCQGVAYDGYGTKFGDMLWQNQVLKWPVYDYDALKTLAKKKGRYYGTDSAGNVYRDGIKDPAHLVTDLKQLNVAGDRSEWGSVDYDVVFVDTTDENPPAPDGSNMISLRLSGAGYSWKGFYYLCANLDVSGLGTPSAIPCGDPGGANHDLNIFMDGILLVNGNLDKGSGNNQIFGSVYAEKGYIGTGTLDVYYNIKLKDGFPFPIQSRVDLVMWKIEE